MNPSNPIDLLFGGMGKLGPGSDAETLKVLRVLPRREYRLIIDAGCGTGRQTITLARELNSVIHAIDSYEPFLGDLRRRARDSQIEHLVQTHCMDMKDIPHVFQDVDLLWSEGAAYNIGFANALITWAGVMKPDGFVVVSELSWLRDQVPDAVKEFFQSGYPDMQSVQNNLAAAESAGYMVLATRTVPREAWVEGYYDILAPRARALIGHPDPGVRDFAAETLREIEIFEYSEGSYGYVFYVLQHA